MYQRIIARIMLRHGCYFAASSSSYFNKQVLFQSCHYYPSTLLALKCSSSSSSSTPPPSPTNKQQKRRRKRLDVAIIGMPNAGKSQLLNEILQTKVVAVSRKRHTTRKGVFGSRTFDNEKQLVFVDTPGYMKAEDAEAEAAIITKLIEFAKDNVADCDLSLIVVDAAKAMTDPVRETLASLMLHACMCYEQQKETFTLDQLGQQKSISTGQIDSCFASIPLVIVLNKVDLVNPKNQLINLAYEMSVMADTCWEKAEHMVLAEKKKESSSSSSMLDDGISLDTSTASINDNNNKVAGVATVVASTKQREECPVFMISALHNDGIDDILNMLLTEAKVGEWMMEADERTEMSPEERTQEIIREKIYRSVHREVPHQVFLPELNRRFEYLTVPATSATHPRSSTTMEPAETTTKVLRIEQDLVVQTKSHKRLLQGKNGITLQRMTIQSQRDLEHLFNCQVSLALRVKVRRNRKQQQGDADDDDDDDE